MKRKRSDSQTSSSHKKAHLLKDGSAHTVSPTTNSRTGSTALLKRTQEKQASQETDITSKPSAKKKSTLKKGTPQSAPSDSMAKRLKPDTSSFPKMSLSTGQGTSPKLPSTKAKESKSSESKTAGKKNQEANESSSKIASAKVSEKASKTKNATVLAKNLKKTSSSGAVLSKQQPKPVTASSQKSKKASTSSSSGPVLSKQQPKPVTASSQKSKKASTTNGKNTAKGKKTNSVTQKQSAASLQAKGHKSVQDVRKSISGKKGRSEAEAQDIVDDEEYDESVQLRAANWSIIQEMARMREEMQLLKQRNEKLRTEFELWVGPPQTAGTALVPPRLVVPQSPAVLPWPATVMLNNSQACSSPVISQAYSSPVTSQAVLAAGTQPQDSLQQMPTTASLREHGAPAAAFTDEQSQVFAVRRSGQASNSNSQSSKHSGSKPRKTVAWAEHTVEHVSDVLSSDSVKRKTGQPKTVSAAENEKRGVQESGLESGRLQGSQPETVSAATNQSGQEVDAPEPAVAKRGRGRPKKNVTVADQTPETISAVTNQSSQEVDAPEPAVAKRGRGHTKKNVTVADQTPETISDVANQSCQEVDAPERAVAKRGRGRPKKNVTMADQTSLSENEFHPKNAKRSRDKPTTNSSSSDCSASVFGSRGASHENQQDGSVHADTLFGTDGEHQNRSSFAPRSGSGQQPLCPDLDIMVMAGLHTSLSLPTSQQTLSKQSQNEAPEDDHQLGFSSDMSSPSDPVERQQQERIGSSVSWAYREQALMSDVEDSVSDGWMSDGSEPDTALHDSLHMALVNILEDEGQEVEADSPSHVSHGNAPSTGSSQYSDKNQQHGNQQQPSDHQQSGDQQPSKAQLNSTQSLTSTGLLRPCFVKLHRIDVAAAGLEKPSAPAFAVSKGRSTHRENPTTPQKKRQKETTPEEQIPSKKQTENEMEKQPQIETSLEKEMQKETASKQSVRGMERQARQRSTKPMAQSTIEVEEEGSDINSSGDEFQPDASDDCADDDSDYNCDASNASKYIDEQGCTNQTLGRNHRRAAVRATAVVRKTLKQKAKHLAKKPVDGPVRQRRLQICPFCKTSVMKLSRHLRARHKTEEAVQTLLKEKNKEKRKRLQERLRNVGIHLHNEEVLESGQGDLLVKAKLTTVSTSVADFNYIACAYCFAYIRRPQMFRHLHRCGFAPKDRAETHEAMEDAAKFLSSVTHTETSAVTSCQWMNISLPSTLRQLVPRNFPSRYKQAVQAVQSDKLISEWAESELQAARDTGTGKSAGRSLVLLGKLLLRLRALCSKPNAPLREFLTLDQLDAVAEEAKTMAWENSGALTERSKSYALKLVCRAVSKCCCLLQEEAAHAKEIEKERNLLQFQTQLEKRLAHTFLQYLPQIPRRCRVGKSKQRAAKPVRSAHVTSSGDPGTSTGNPDPVTSSGNPAPVTSSGDPVTSSGDAVTSGGNPDTVASSDNPDPVTCSGDSDPVTSCSDPDPVECNIVADPVSHGDPAGNRDPAADIGDYGPSAAGNATDPVTTTGTTHGTVNSESLDPAVYGDDTDPVIISGDLNPAADVDNAHPATRSGDTDPAACGDSADPAVNSDHLNPVTNSGDTDPVSSESVADRAAITSISNSGDLNHVTVTGDTDEDPAVNRSETGTVTSNRNSRPTPAAKGDSSDAGNSLPNTSSTRPVTKNTRQKLEKENGGRQQGIWIPTSRCQKFWCLYCGKKYGKIGRHLMSQHTNETPVWEWLKETDAKEKKKRFLWLRGQGNHKHNLKVLEAGEGEFIVRKPSVATPDSYYPCPGCWGYLHKDYLKRHVQKCELGPLDAEKVMMDVMEESHRRKLESGFVVPEVKLKDKAFAQSVVGLALSHGHSVEENKAMSSDRLMMALAERLAQRSSSSDADSVADNLRRMLKALACLLIQLRHGVGQYDASLEDFLTTDRFDVLMCAVRAVSESFSEGSFLMSISYWIGWLVNLLLEEAEEQGDYEKLVRVRSFSIQLYYEWTDVYEELKGLCPEKRKMSKRGDQQRAKTEEKSGVTEVPAQSTEVNAKDTELQSQEIPQTDSAKQSNRATEVKKRLVSSDGKSVKRKFPSSSLLNSITRPSEKGSKRTWSATERNAVFRHLGNFIETGQVPGKLHILRCIVEEPCLARRSWKNVKDFCRNVMRSYRIPQERKTAVKSAALKADDRSEEQPPPRKKRKSRPESSASKPKVLDLSDHGDTLFDSDHESGSSYKPDSSSSSDEEAPDLPSVAVEGRVSSDVQLKQVHTEWTEKERKAVTTHLGKFLQLGSLPRKTDILLCISAESEILSHRSWRNVKDFCRHLMKKKVENVYELFGV